MPHFSLSFRAAARGETRTASDIWFVAPAVPMPLALTGLAQVVYSVITERKPRAEPLLIA